MSASVSPLVFPCRFPVKAIGHANAGLEATVLATIRRHTSAVQPEHTRVTPSRNGRYVSVTVTITAQSREQLDAIYHDLQTREAVLATL